MRNLELLSLGDLVGDPLSPGLVLVLDEGEGKPHLGVVALAGNLLDPGLLDSNVPGHLPVEDAGDIRQTGALFVMACVYISYFLMIAALDVEVVEVEKNEESRYYESQAFGRESSHCGFA